MPMMNWLAMHHVDLFPENWMAWVVIGFLIAGVIAVIIIAVKYR